MLESEEDGRKKWKGLERKLQTKRGREEGKKIELYWKRNPSF